MLAFPQAPGTTVPGVPHRSAYASISNRVTVGSTSEADFLRAAFGHYAHEYVRRVARRRTQWRVPPVVRREYDDERQRQLDRLATLHWDDALFGPPSVRDFVLVNDRIVWDGYRAPLEAHLRRLRGVVAAATHDGDTIVEFCSGNGRNLLYLKRAFPALHCVGLELSPTSVELARRLAERFGLDVDFRVCDVTQAGGAMPAPGEAAVAFSYHGLEQMPRIFERALARMCTVAARRVHLLEPVPELWPRDARGLVGRLRVHALDRLRGLPRALERSLDRGDAARGWRVLSATRLGTAVNPLNETCEVALARDGA